MHKARVYYNLEDKDTSSNGRSNSEQKSHSIISSRTLEVGKLNNNGTASVANGKTKDEPKMQWGSIWIAAILLFFVSVQFSLYFASLWPYMSQIDPTADQTFYGFTLAAFSAGQMIASPLLGFWNHRIKKAKPVIAVAVCFTMTGNIVYMFTEASRDNRKWIIMCSRFIYGLGAGVTGTIKGYVATASTPQHRARAIAIGTAALSMGITAGPVVQACVTPIGYPGLVLGPLHINQYTAPAYLSMCGCLILMTCLFTIFKERYVGIDDRKKTNPFHFVPKYDKMAAFLCIVCWFAMFFSITNSETVQTPYTMALFNWNNSDAVFYNSMILVCSSSISLVLYIAFAIYGERKNERVSIIIGLCMLTAFYVITYPWPFFTGRLTFKSAPLDVPHSTTTLNATSSTATLNQTDSYRNVGCDLKMQWCKDTPKLPLAVYLGAYPLLAIGFPTCVVSINTLYSKILGPRKQGFMQSLMAMSGSFSRLLGPILISWLFVNFGPRVSWVMTGSVVLFSVCAFASQYKRLVPLNTKPKLCSGQKLKYDGGVLYHL